MRFVGPPAVRSGPPFPAPESRANVHVAFRRPPHLLESPLRPSPPEGLRKVCFSPIRLSNSVSNFHARVLALCNVKLAPQQSQAGQGWATRGVVDLSRTAHRRVLSRVVMPFSQTLSLLTYCDV